MVKSRVVIALVIAFISGCGDGSGEEKNSQFIPDIPFECTSGQAAGCGGSGLPVFAGLIESLGGADCDDFLTGMNASTRQRTFLVSANVTSTRRGIYLTGTAAGWTNSLGTEIDVLRPGQYHLCAFVDENSNGFLDTNEPVGAGMITVGQVGFILTEWSAAYN